MQIERWLNVCFASLLMATSCEQSFDSYADEDAQLVVEGWIEDGGFPIVLLTRSLPVSTEYQRVDNMGDYILRWAKVSVNDGKDTVVVTGKYDDGYFPPFVYTTSRMRGEAGRHYSLTVDYRDFHAESTTIIPLPPRDCAFEVDQCNDSDTLFQVMVSFKDNPNEKNYYQAFVREGTTAKQYLASYLGSLDDTVLDTLVLAPIFRGRKYDNKEYTPYYTIADTISVKIASIDEASFRFWNSFTKMITLSNNMFLSASADIETNISGGSGYWCGYGSVTNHIVIRDSISINESQ